jgi:hypothetical protein
MNRCDAERAAPGLRVAHLHGGGDRRRVVVDLPEEAGQVAGEVVERPARGDDVDEPEERGLEVGVGGREVHRLGVERLERVPRRGRHRGRQRLADAEQLALECLLLHPAAETIEPSRGISRC